MYLCTAFHWTVSSYLVPIAQRFFSRNHSVWCIPSKLYSLHSTQIFPSQRLLLWVFNLSQYLTLVSFYSSIYYIMHPIVQHCFHLNTQKKPHIGTNRILSWGPQNAPTSLIHWIISRNLHSKTKKYWCLPYKIVGKEHKSIIVNEERKCSLNSIFFSLF